MAQIVTNEGLNDGEDNKLAEWLKKNKLERVKEKFDEYQISIDELKSVDINCDLEYGLIIYIYLFMHNI